ncbi:hypothetical protein DPMN_082576 [Dreissena polymorpha]|uniref:Uncharacterized protein n=1 Tax=Dreissena polymorpha TaxID=45954 RepID=A0A9D3Y7T7_DREPO|nr:hypothetical protein DPMN_082576 [Dreissena polymorpha]
MKLLSAIRSHMKIKVLKTIFETVYGQCAIVHITAWKAVQRALRGRFLVDKADELYSFLLRGVKTLADATCIEILIKIETVTEMKTHELAQP